MAAAIALSGVLLAGCGWPAFGGDTITVTVRNNTDEDAILEITESQLRVLEGARTIAPPIVIPPGEHQVRLGSPQMEWSLKMRGAEGFFPSQRLHDWQRQVETGELGSFWLEIEAGVLNVATGVGRQ